MYEQIDWHLKNTSTKFGLRYKPIEVVCLSSWFCTGKSGLAGFGTRISWQHQDSFTMEAKGDHGFMRQAVELPFGTKGQVVGCFPYIVWHWLEWWIWWNRYSSTPSILKYNRFWVVLNQTILSSTKITKRLKKTLTTSTGIIRCITKLVP
jgi:hypothetical protein